VEKPWNTGATGERVGPLRGFIGPDAGDIHRIPSPELVVGNVDGAFSTEFSTLSTRVTHCLNIVCGEIPP
jgi:hypothetical protein